MTLTVTDFQATGVQARRRYSLQKIKADVNLSEPGAPVSFNAGSSTQRAIRLRRVALPARGAVLTVVVVAHITDFKFKGAFSEPGDPSKVDLESKTTWAAAAGANIRLTDNVLTEFKCVPWSANEKGGVIFDAIKVDPLTFAARVRFRF